MIFKDESNELFQESHDYTVAQALKHNAVHKIARLCKMMQVGSIFDVNFSTNNKLAFFIVKFLA